MGKTCCFLGHRKIEETLELRKKLYNLIEKLIVNDDIDVFLFGSRSEFNSLCYEIVSGLKGSYPHIKRVYVRAEYPHINDNYKAYLMEKYEDTYYPESILLSAKAVYIERNYHIIDKSSICVMYFSPDYKLTHTKSSTINRQTKSGTEIAYKYAEKKGKLIINVLN